ncbi:RICIN domain-containing protein [Neisseria montereyensis]|uniref:Ricin-type beta-trefoil lectin domain protein n=1 Tax=Neisseria montereyensis TaxID=2973938 RepID=A0ABT2FBG6_9NEIS|nr:ricin-type beta-trefoil lectin domain protein [Neisseria montereyensis]MCS4533440.1 ricin-type beta-trefoil lectin domain protein [Neisseria montereyensis]
MKTSAVFLLFPAFVLVGCASGVNQSKPSAKTVQAASSAGYHIQTATGKCLQLDGKRKQIITANCDDKSSQRFAISGNDIRIEGMCLTTSGTGKNKGRRLSVQQCVPSAAQQWYREGQTIRSKLNGRCLETTGQTGMPVRLAASCSNKRSRHFSFTR